MENTSWRTSCDVVMAGRGLKVRRTSTDSSVRAQELCESRGERPGLPVPNKPTVSVDVNQHSTSHDSELRSCVKVEVAVLGSPSLINLWFLWT